MNASNASTQALPEIATRRNFARATPTRTQPIPALQIHREPTLSIIVPIHNEKPKVHSFLVAVDRAAVGFKPEVVFVDSGEDQAEKYLEKIKDRFPFEIRCVFRDSANVPTDLAGAAVQGFISARLEWMCVASIDLKSFPTTFSSLLLEGTTDSSDLVLGSRRYQKSWIRAGSLKLLSLGARLFLPEYLKGLSDPLTNLFIVRRSSLFLNRMTPKGDRVLPEILKRFPYLEVRELPLNVDHTKNEPFNPSLRDDLRSAISLAQLHKSTKNR